MYFPSSNQQHETSLSRTDQREIQHYVLTNREERSVKTFSQSKFKQLLMHVLLETNLDHKEFSILKPSKRLPLSDSKQKFPLPKLTVFNTPRISQEPSHQPFAVGERGEVAAVLGKSKVYIAPSCKAPFKQIDLSSFPPITSLHIVNRALFTGDISGNLFVFDSETLQRRHKIKSSHAIGPMTYLNPHTEIISNWRGTISLFDTRSATAKKLYSSTSFNGYQALTHHTSYLAFCDINQFTLIDIRSPKSPLQQIDGTYDRVAFNQAGVLGIGSENRFSLISPADLVQKPFTYPGRFCGLSSLEETSFATSRFDPTIERCTIELLTTSKNEVVIDRVIDKREGADALDVDHIIPFGQKLFCAATREELLKVWDFSVNKPEKKNSALDPFESELTIR